MVPSVLFSALKEGFQFLGKKLDGIATAVKGIDVDISPAVNKQTVVLGKGLDAILKAVNVLKDPKITVDLDTAQLSADLKTFAKGMKDVFPKTDLSNVEASLAIIASYIQDGNKQKSQLLTALKTATEAIENIKVNVPAALKLDEMQMRALTASRSGGGGVMPARKVTVANTSMALANTEYSYTFPANTVSWSVKLRSQNTLLLYSFTTGKLPTSGDGSAYMTAPQNFVQSQDGVDWSGKTIYVQTGSASQTLEVTSYQL